MNRKKIAEFADFLAKSRRKFDMFDSQHCIAGECARWDDPEYFHAYPYGSSSTLVGVLGIPPNEAYNIYSGPGVLTTRKQAVAMLRRLARTGKVDWGRRRVKQFECPGQCPSRAGL